MEDTREGEVPWKIISTTYIISLALEGISKNASCGNRRDNNGVARYSPPVSSSSSSSAPVVSPPPLYVLAKATGPEVVSLLSNILSDDQRFHICKRTASKVLIQKGEIRANEALRTTDDREKIAEKTRWIMKNETNRYIFVERLPIRDFLECGLSIAQIHRYFAPTFSDLVHLGISIADITNYRRLVSFSMLGSLYDPDAIRQYFGIRISSIWKHGLTYDDLNGIGFQITPQDCTFSNKSFVSSQFGLEQMDLSPYELAGIGVTLPMLYGLGFHENTSQQTLSSLGWTLHDFRDAFDITTTDESKGGGK